ncbi:hypothetical protein L2E82_49953 [Cichorium intybus]|nr:hypothetical protein L2E82_49953 [Cichorium intybus]
MTLRSFSDGHRVVFSVFVLRSRTDHASFAYGLNFIHKIASSDIFKKETGHNLANKKTNQYSINFCSQVETGTSSQFFGEREE